MKKSSRKKKMTLNELGSMVEHVINHMATKEDIERLEAKDDQALGHAVAMHDQMNNMEAELKTLSKANLPQRISDLEIELFGSSKTPKTN